MTFLNWMSKHKYRFIHTGLIGLILLISPVAHSLFTPAAEVRNMELISVGTGGVQADESSFFVTTSADGRYATFISFARNLAPDHPGNENWLDVFVRDRQSDETIKVTFAHGGGLSDESSYDPHITADGRYVSYFSYAENLVPNDNNGHEWLREGIDVFVYDMQNETTKRVTLTSTGEEIKGNSIGFLIPDGRYALFYTSGQVFSTKPNKGQTAVYLRDWHSGDVERISKAMDGGYPNESANAAVSNYDGRYIVYVSEASNLVAEETNKVANLYLYDRITGETRLITKAFDGNPSNNHSGHAQMSDDGRYTLFLSHATNLVSWDSNGSTDIFIYDRVTDKIRRVSVADDGAQANGLSKDPSICANSRFVSFTTEATNLVSGDTNGERDVILHDLVTGRKTVATINESGEWGNSKAHRSYLTPDCRAITFASDATNLVPVDTNSRRDIFMGQIYLPADLTPSTLANRSFLEPGDRLVYTYTVRNIGYETSSATLISKVPSDTIYLDGSVTGGGIFNSADNQMEWQVAVTGGSEIKFSYAVTVDASLVDPTLITNRSILSNEEWEWMLEGYTMVNGRQTYFPLIKLN
jgi:TolB protein